MPAAKGADSRAEGVGQRRANLAKANRRKAQIAALRAEVRRARLGPAELLGDKRAAQVNVLTLLSMVPRCTLRAALEALLLCQINGARRAGELNDSERQALVAALAKTGQGVAVPLSYPTTGRPERVDRELDRAVSGTRRSVPAVELAPSEFAAARTGLEADPLLLRMVDRLVAALRLYASKDDGGLRAQVVLEQWVRYRNYISKLGRGECPPPTQRGPAVLE